MIKKIDTLNNIFIKKENIISNLNLIKNTSKKEVFPVLKSNAYWHWLKEIATILKWQNLKYLVVDSYYEALIIQKYNKTPILLIGYVDPNNFKKMKLKNITLMIWNKENLIKLWESKRKAIIHLKINTWMNRLWFKLKELEDVLNLLEKYKNITLEWVYSHFSQADETNNNFTNNQIDIFKKAIEKIKSNWFDLKYTHIGNSAWSIKNLDFCNATRAGFAIYGMNPLDKKDVYFNKYKNLKTALEIESTLISKNNLSKWEFVWYGKNYKAKKDMIIWVIPFWYFEWLPRELNEYFVEYKWQKLKIIWKCCMNMTIIDLTWVDINIWDKIKIISINSDNNFYTLAKSAWKIPYEIMVWINESIRREIV